jgi:aminoglycoside phosphotransferase (APT) family kinase protein
MLTRPRDLDAVRARLETWLRSRLGGDAAIAALSKPAAGMSNDTLLCEVTRAGRTERLVVRLAPNDFQVFPEYDLAAQYRLLACLAATDVPAPRVRWLETDVGVLGCPFYVMEAIAGEVPSEIPNYHAFGLLFDADPARRARMWWSGIETLAKIHALDWARLGLDFLGVPGPGTDPLDRQLAYWRRYYAWARNGRTWPICAAALDWLEAHRFVPRDVRLCWGDARLPNLVFRDDTVVGVLDWEMAFLGDPEADLGWWLFMDWATGPGYGLPRLAGLPGREETIARYEALTGRRVTHPLWHEVFAAVRFALIMARIARRMEEVGLPAPNPHFELDNPNTRRLAELLDLPPPP